MIFLQLRARSPEESSIRLEVTQEQGGAQATSHCHGCISCTCSCCQKHRALGTLRELPLWTLSGLQAPLPTKAPFRDKALQNSPLEWSYSRLPSGSQKARIPRTHPPSPESLKDLRGSQR